MLINAAVISVGVANLQRHLRSTPPPRRLDNWTAYIAPTVIQVTVSVPTMRGGCWGGGGGEGGCQTQTTRLITPGQR